MKRLIRSLLAYKLFSLSLVTVVAGLALELDSQATAARWLLAVVSLIAVCPLLWNMWQDLRSGRYGIDILAATAIITAVILGQDWAAIVVVLMLTGGEALEDFAEHRARSELDALLKRAPRLAHVIRKGKTLDVKVNDLRVGDKILIRPGDMVPVDAVVLEGTASFDESSLTGESLPEIKAVNDKLLSGSINLDGAITAKVTATAADSQYQQIIKLVQSAAASQAPFVRLADRYSIPFTIAAYAIALSVWALSGQAIRFLEVIIVATPCPLLLAAPIALVSGMARASTYGIIVKTGSALEKLAGAGAVAFDKTGTLTHGRLIVESIVRLDSLTANEVLALAAGLEQKSGHVVAHAIVAAAQDRKLKPTKTKHVSEIAGLGLRASVRGQQVLVGRLSFMESNGVKPAAKAKREPVNKTVVYVAVDSKLVGFITLKDELRADSRETIHKLRQLGIREIVMVTGDNQATAKAIAKQLGISHVHAEALPADKLRVLEEIKDRPLVFVGDGVNDAPILTAADVGIALGARGSTAASESADMVIMLDDIGRVAVGLDIAKRTFQIARQSILVGIGLSLGLMLIFATGKFRPLAGAIIQEGVDVVVIFNALRAHLINVSD